VVCDQIVKFEYTPFSSNYNQKEELSGWDCREAFRQLLGAWRSDVCALHEINEEKFRFHVESEEIREADTVSIIYRVWKSSSGSQQYVGHVRYRGGADGEGNVEIATQGLVMEFDEKPPVKATRTYKFRNLALETAVLTFLRGKHAVRIRTGSPCRDWSFRFDKEAEKVFRARQHEFSLEEYAEIEDEASSNGLNGTGKCSEYRPKQDTVLVIGEIPTGRDKERYDEQGTLDDDAWSPVKEDDFKTWARDAFFLRSHSFTEFATERSGLTGNHWSVTDTCEVLYENQWLGRGQFYLNDLSLKPRDRQYTERALRFSYNSRQFTHFSTPIKTAEEEARAVARIWDAVVLERDNPLVLGLLSDLLGQSESQYRDAGIGRYLRKETRSLLQEELAKDRHMEKRVRKTKSAAGTSDTSRITQEPSSRAEPLIEPIPTTSGPGKTPSMSPGSTRTTGQSPRLSSTNPSTAPSVEPAPLLGAVLRDQIRQLQEQLEAQKEISANLLEQVETVKLRRNAFLEEMEMVKAEERRNADALEQARRVEPDSCEVMEAVQRRKPILWEKSGSRTTASTSTQTDDASVIDDLFSNIARLIPLDLPPSTDVAMENPSEERVVSIPDNPFAREVMRLVQATLRFLPQPMSTYAIQAIQGGTGVVVAGFCRFDHNECLLKLHKDWLSEESMGQELTWSQDDRRTDLIAYTMLAFWETLFNSEPSERFDADDGRAVRARCRTNVWRQVHDYVRACRQIHVAPGISRPGELWVATSHLANSGWAAPSDSVILSLHHEDCHWHRQLSTTSDISEDPLDPHLVDITTPSKNGAPAYATACCGIKDTAATDSVASAVHFPGLSSSAAYSLVAINLNRPDAPVVVFEGLRLPQARPGTSKRVAKEAYEWRKRLNRFTEEGITFQSMLRDGPSSSSWPDASTVDFVESGQDSDEGDNGIADTVLDFEDEIEAQLSSSLGRSAYKTFKTSVEASVRAVVADPSTAAETTALLLNLNWRLHQDWISSCASRLGLPSPATVQPENGHDTVDSDPGQGGADNNQETDIYGGNDSARDLDMAFSQPCLYCGEAQSVADMARHEKRCGEQPQRRPEPEIERAPEIELESEPEVSVSSNRAWMSVASLCEGATVDWGRAPERVGKVDKRW
jgi:hypothetical protein